MNKIIIILIALIIIYYFYNKISKNDLIPNFFGKKKNIEIEKDEEVFEAEEEIHTEDVNDYFNLDTEKEEIIPSNEKRDIVFLDIETNGHQGRVIIELRNDIVPKTCLNFVTLCEKKAYVGTRFHRVIKDFMIQGGDFTENDGTGGVSIYGNSFEDENFHLKHKKGVISMANSGPDSNGSQFFITVKDTEWLDGKHVVFGKIMKGLDLIEWVSTLDTNESEIPLQDIVVADCGRFE